MNKSYIKKEGGKTLYIFEQSGEEELNTVAVNMLKNNAIAGLVPCTFSQFDDTKYIKYDITGRIPFKEFLERSTSFDIVADLFINISRGFIQLRRYMIDPSELFFDFDKMYINTLVPNADFIVDPLCGGHSAEEPKNLFINIIVNVKMNSEDNGYIGHVLSLLNVKNFSLERFIEGLEFLKEEHIALPQKMSEKKSENIDRIYHAPNQQSTQNVWKTPTAEENIVLPNADNSQEQIRPTAAVKKKGIGGIFKREKKIVQSHKKQKITSTAKNSGLQGFAIPGADNDNNDVLSSTAGKRDNSAAEIAAVPGSDEVSRPSPELRPVQMPQSAIVKESEFIPHVNRDEYNDDQTQMIEYYAGEGLARLVRVATREIIYIDKDTFNIGRDPKALLDYVISDSRVSRRHASIICRDGEYFAADRNSRNHTYLNGKILPPNIETALKSGDVIRFGSEEFIFEI